MDASEPSVGDDIPIVEHGALLESAADGADSSAVAPSQADADKELPNADEFQLTGAFYDAYKSYSSLLRAEDRETPEQADLDKLLSQLKAIAWHVDQLRLFSPNEELDDINTVDLKFLLVPYMLAEVANATMDMQRRLEIVKAALVYYRIFAHSCERLNIVHQDDLAALGRSGEERVNPAEKRSEKIARFKRSKELDQKAAYLFAKKRRQTGDEFLWGTAGFDEDLERELTLSLLTRAGSGTADAVAVAQEEIPMLEIMMARGGPDAPPPRRERPSAEKPWVIRIQDKSELQQIYLQQVFQPDIPIPTMTLGECADIEMEQAREIKQREFQRELAAKVDEDQRWYGGDRYGSKEDWEDEMKTVKDRDWDDWKDAHPYGSGNKHRNLG